MISKNDSVTIVGGHYKGNTGIVKSVRCSKRDGISFVVAFDEEGYEGLVRSKFVRLNESKPKKHPLEGVWLTVAGSKILEHSEAETEEQQQHLEYFTRYSKNALVTLVYEEDGELLANVVFQGMYAVVKVSSLNPSLVNKPGLC